MTKSIWPKWGLNMTKTDKPYWLEHDRKMTMTNLNSLILTESNWIWPNTKIKIKIRQRQKYMIEVDRKLKYYHNDENTRLKLTKNWKYCIQNFWSYSHDHFHCCGNFSVKFKKSILVVVSFQSSSNFSVKFNRSYCIRQINNPPF